MTVYLHITIVYIYVRVYDITMHIPTCLHPTYAFSGCCQEIYAYYTKDDFSKDLDTQGNMIIFWKLTLSVI